MRMAGSIQAAPRVGQAKRADRGKVGDGRSAAAVAAAGRGGEPRHAGHRAAPGPQGTNNPVTGCRVCGAVGG
jgi:hypothetical protein